MYLTFEKNRCVTFYTVGRWKAMRREGTSLYSSSKPARAHTHTHTPITVHITLTKPVDAPKCYLALLQVIIQLFLLKKLLHFCFHQHSAHVDDLIHCQGEALHRVAEFLLISKKCTRFRFIAQFLTVKYMISELNVLNYPLRQA